MDLVEVDLYMKKELRASGCWNCSRNRHEVSVLSPIVIQAVLVMNTLKQLNPIQEILPKMQPSAFHLLMSAPKDVSFHRNLLTPIKKPSALRNLE